MIPGGRLDAELPMPGPEEAFLTLAEGGGARVERIVSRGHATPPGQWYDQGWDEWVMVVSGAARLRLAEEAAPREMGPGHWVFIPAHARHRVEWTAPDQDTLWLAVHFPPPSTPPDTRR